MPKDLKDKYGEIEWRDIVAFRNIAVHAYFSIDWFIVWKAATKNAPELGLQAAEILKKEFPDAKI